ncbi:hypothetical protein DIRU0_B08152 [Diutina rugosa]
MPFRANDYNAFLTTLLDRDQPLPGDAPVSPHSTSAPMPPPPSGTAPGYYDSATPNQASLAMDFDFGMMPVSQGMAPPPAPAVPLANGVANGYFNGDYTADLGASGAPPVPMGGAAHPGAGASFSSASGGGTGAQSPLSDPARSPKSSSPKSSSPRPRVKSAHNIIEQRYRNKINDKFNALQMSVPALRSCARRKAKKMSASARGGRGGSYSDSDSDDCDGAGSGDEDLEGLEPARKLNKGTILAKSVEYIKFLELKNERMKYEQQQLMAKAQMMGIDISHIAP